MLYIKRILNQDIEKEMAFTPEPSKKFFDYNYDIKDEPRRDLFFTYKPLEGNGFSLGNNPIKVTMRDHVEKNESKITSELRSFLKNDLHAEKDDLLLINNNDINNTLYTFDLLKKDTPLYNIYNEILATNHQLVVEETNINDLDDFEETLCIPLMTSIGNKSNEELYKILGKALNDEYLKASKTNKAVAGIYVFGLKYRKLILDHNLDENKIIENAPDVKESFYYELNKAKNIYLYAKELGYIRKDTIQEEKETEVQKLNTRWEQIIYYGVPGSGKSFKINETTKDLPSEQKMRVVFHPEYTNADFVGQILPIEDDGVDYRFKAGPFSRILKRALMNPQKPYYLIIEEINRGNAAAIFGDLFQLLDRDENGNSSYPIENIDINSFIRSSGYTHNDKIVPSTVKVGDTDFTELTEIYLPSNLSIFATMNTSDQNVFTLDNAFQRRWQMELVENTFSDLNNPEQANQFGAKIQGFDVLWGNFQEDINDEISKQATDSGLSSMEDKRLGCWFVKPDINNSIISSKQFSEKVLKYLWDDAFKFSRKEVFEDYDTLESLSRAFKQGENVFKNKTFLSKKETQDQING